MISIRKTMLTVRYKNRRGILRVWRCFVFICSPPFKKKRGCLFKQYFWAPKRTLETCVGVRIGGRYRNNIGSPITDSNSRTFTNWIQCDIYNRTMTSHTTTLLVVKPVVASFCDPDTLTSLWKLSRLAHNKLRGSVGHTGDLWTWWWSGGAVVMASSFTRLDSQWTKCTYFVDWLIKWPFKLNM